MIKNKRKGISIITLIISVVVIIILAATIILAIAKNNPIKNADIAVFKQDAAVVQEMLNLQIADITLDSMEPPELYMDETYTEKVTDRVQINKDSAKIGKLYYATSKEKGCIVFGREVYANIKQVTEVATNETVAIENIVYRYTEEDLPTYKDKSIKWYVTSTNRVVLEAGDIIVDGDDENNGETGDEIEDDTSVIAEPGIYKMTVNAGTVASWLGIEVKELNIPEGASIEYSFEASDDNITYDAAVSNIEQVRKSQYLRVRLILTSNEKNECPSFRSVRVKFNIGDEMLKSERRNTLNPGSGYMRNQ